MSSYQQVEMLSKFNSLVFKEALANPKITPASIGLDKVNNTSDDDKPISNLIFYSAIQDPNDLSDSMLLHDYKCLGQREVQKYRHPKTQHWIKWEQKQKWK